MKKTILFVTILLVTAVTYAQKDKELKLNEDTNLIEATYYHDNGQVSQQGTFTIAGKLHGKWVSFNEAGEKISVGSYKNGLKTGKWFFWSDEILKEVEYSNNAIAGVTQIEDAKGIVNHR